MVLLDKLQNLLDEEDYQWTFLPASEKLAIDSLLILIGLDNQQREQKLEVIEFAQNLSMEVTPPTDMTSITRLQFKVLLPFKVDDLAINDVSAFIHFINLSIDLPGYEFNELEGQVMYRYVWITQGDNLDKNIVKNILTVINMNVVLFSEIIESLANGQMTFNELLSDIVKKFKTES